MSMSKWSNHSHMLICAAAAVVVSLADLLRDTWTEVPTLVQRRILASPKS